MVQLIIQRKWRMYHAKRMIPDLASEFLKGKKQGFSVKQMQLKVEEKEEGKYAIVQILAAFCFYKDQCRVFLRG